MTGLATGPLIDRLALACRVGQGQIGAKRVRSGLWNARIDVPAQPAVNQLLRRLTPAEREVLAQMLAQEFVGGVHETLVVLYEAQVEPFQDGYEGTPFHDFVGRLDDWPWPSER
ncbi:hypothetical protein E0H73_00470 [Kribbella pittospori]|uniref:Uncharacterized protein n=1 Tax=Kribbella pittospori TaxID=722689 RepID=A0A4R0KXI1_9ACTN|nr:DUF6547 family protein [Kribbella pittospori]TCC65459.1 hypothetical protein E0H73_00470 [Kribbella pittospori]